MGIARPDLAADRRPRTPAQAHRWLSAHGLPARLLCARATRQSTAARAYCCVLETLATLLFGLATLLIGTGDAGAAALADDAFRVELAPRQSLAVFDPVSVQPPLADGPASASGSAAAARSGTVELYIDDQRISSSALDQPFGGHAMTLRRGSHLFRFSVSLSTTDGAGRPAVSDDDCVGQFAVDGPLVLQPRLVFVLLRPAPGKFADLLDCSLTATGQAVGR